MPLTTLIPMVVLGIAGIAVLLHLTGRSRRCILSPEAAEAAWLRQFPADRVTEVTVAHDGHAALIVTDHGSGLLWAFGADTVARRLEAFDLIDRGDRLRIVFRDFTAPAVTLALDTAERRQWLNRIEAA